MADTDLARLRAFVGRSFLAADEGLWLEIRALLESLKPLGFLFEDAKEATPRPVSEKVRLAIDRNDVYIGILSRRDELVDYGGFRRFFSPPRRRWSPPPWVVQESGYALGVEKRVVLLIEEGVEFPTASLDADREWISFNRGAVPLIAPRLVALINHLIAERLPALPTGGAAQVIAPEAPPTPTEQEDKNFPLFFEALHNIHQGNFTEAKIALDKYLRTPDDDPPKKWLPYFYLSQKAIHGDGSSLEDLKSSVKEQPANVAARTQLANYYSHFDRASEGARILLDGLSATGPDGRAQLMRSAAEAYSKAGDHSRSLEILAQLLHEEGGASAETFTSLADAAKAMGNSDLEVAALERVLAFAPGRSRIRFRLAYAYSQSDNKQLALYHYKVRLSQGSDPGSLNNLGVAYGALKLPGKEIESLLKAEDENALARANLSHGYIDRGFLATAEQMAHAVLADASDSSGRDRAAAAVRRIEAMRSKEMDTEEAIEKAARREADFRATYAEAYIGAVAPLVAGDYQTVRGVLTVRQEGDRLTGTASIREPAPSLSLLIGLLPATVRLQTRELTLEGSVHGRAAAFKLKTLVTGEGPAPREDQTEVNGLLVIAGDGRSFQVLEKEKDSTNVYGAHLMEARP
jgi:tetratricopeptide (TPR) repeat protein